jgi:Holliday junction resolvasome RuvABC DNA-binding subunit
VLELRDKVGASADLVIDDAGVANGQLTPLAEAREALRALGYSAGEAQSALADLDHDADTSTLLRQALQRLGSGVGAGR